MVLKSESEGFITACQGAVLSYGKEFGSIPEVGLATKNLKIVYRKHAASSYL